MNPFARLIFFASAVLVAGCSGEPALDTSEDVRPVVARPSPADASSGQTSPAPSPSTSRAKPAPVSTVELSGPGNSSPQALKLGQNLLPLAHILQIAKRAVPGEIIEIDLDEDEDGSAHYELEILTSEGRAVELKINARSGMILEIEED